MIAASRALALVRGRDFVIPQDVIDVAADVLRHRLVLSYDALADGVQVETILTGCCRPSRCRRSARTRSHTERTGDRPDGRSATAIRAGRAPSGAPPRFADPARIDSALANLELTVRRRLDGLLQGNHLGLVPGTGIRARRRPAVPPRGRRPADGLVGDRPHHRGAHPADRRRP